MAITTSMEAIEALPLFAAARRVDQPTSKAASAGHAAGESCMAKAKRVAAFDPDKARAAVLDLLADGVARSGEEIVDHCERLGLVPHDARAFGPVFGTLARRGQIQSVGFAVRRKGHGTAGARIWAAKGASHDV